MTFTEVFGYYLGIGGIVAALALPECGYDWRTWVPYAWVPVYVLIWPIVLLGKLGQ